MGARTTSNTQAQLAVLGEVKDKCVIIASDASQGQPDRMRRRSAQPRTLLLCAKTVCGLRAEVLDSADVNNDALSQLLAIKCARRLLLRVIRVPCRT